MLSRAVLRLTRSIEATKSEIHLLHPIWPRANIFHGSARPGSQRSTTHIDTVRHASSASSSSSTRWKSRQSRDTFAKEAKVAGLKSRAAFKLLEIDSKYRLFKRGDTVVDLGYAPGSWSQVAISKTQPGGRVVGIDVIPAQPPKGVSTLQGDFLSPEIREEVRRFVRVPGRGRARPSGQLGRGWDGEEGLTEDELEVESRGVFGRRTGPDENDIGEDLVPTGTVGQGGDALMRMQRDAAEGRVVNVVLSDMSEPWPLTSSMWIKSVSNPHRRMQNTSGMAFRDHAGSMVCIFPLLQDLPLDPNQRNNRLLSVLSS